MGGKVLAILAIIFAVSKDIADELVEVGKAEIDAAVELSST